MQLLFVADLLCVTSMLFYFEIEPSAFHGQREGGGGYLQTKKRGGADGGRQDNEQ